jgi:hypothetical protein
LCGLFALVTRCVTTGARHWASLVEISANVPALCGFAMSPRRFYHYQNVPTHRLLPCVGCRRTPHQLHQRRITLELIAQGDAHELDLIMPEAFRQRGNRLFDAQLEIGVTTDLTTLQAMQKAIGTLGSLRKSARVAGGVAQRTGKTACPADLGVGVMGLADAVLYHSDLHSLSQTWSCARGFARGRLSVSAFQVDIGAEQLGLFGKCVDRQNWIRACSRS